MLIAKVVGHVVSTQKDANLVGCKLLIVAPLERKGEVSDRIGLAVDAVGAGYGETVMLAQGSAARLAIDNTNAPVDLAIIGIVDTVEIE